MNETLTNQGHRLLQAGVGLLIFASLEGSRFHTSRPSGLACLGTH